MRVAFFVEENQHANTVLDAIFARMYGFWGGRFSLIVPCENGHYREHYAPWLEKFDPDVIYSYVDLQDEAVAHIHERFYPSFLSQHRAYDPQDVSAHGFRPNLPIHPLSIATLLPLAAGPFMFESAAPTRIFDTMGTTSNNRFIQDSFGSWTTSYASSFPGHLREYGHVLALIESGELQPRERYIRAPDETVSTVTELLSSIRVGRFSNVCGTSESAPVSRPWQFRLNEFVREALRKHGVLPIFWALSKLRDMREESFFFEGQHPTAC